MLGFIKKDLLMVKENLKVLLVLILVYAFMIYQDGVELVYLIPFVTVMLIMNTFNYESYNHWDAYAITLPKGRKRSVASKYLATLIIIIITSLVIALFTFVIVYIKTKTISFAEILVPMFGSIVGTSLILSFIYPTIYKFGIEKARIYIVVFVFGFAILLGLLIQYINFPDLSNVFSFLEDYLIIIIALVTVLLLYISYKISLHVYLKKEF